MKNSKIITAFITLNLIIFMSVTSIATPNNRHTGDLVKTAVKNQIEVSKNNLETEISALKAESVFSHLRFDVNKFISESETAELLNSTKNKLRFDVNNFLGENETEISELPFKNELEYLRFDVSGFAGDNSVEITEMPVNEFNYLQFDVTRFSNENSDSINELPVD